MDNILDCLGSPCGTAAYRPIDARGEDYLHNYLGMCGIALEGYTTYPKKAASVFLNKSAAADPDILSKMHDSLMDGGDVIVTSGFVKAAGPEFTRQFVSVTVSDRKAYVQTYANTKDNGLTVTGKYAAEAPILIPQLDYCTNDIWELAAAYGNDMNYPIVLRCRYGNGRLSIITIPDNMGDLYTYPAPVLGAIRDLFSKSAPVQIDGPSKVMLFLYDNDTFILRSDLPYDESFTLKFTDDVRAVTNLDGTGKYSLQNNCLTLRLTPSQNYFFRLIR